MRQEFAISASNIRAKIKYSRVFDFILGIIYLQFKITNYSNNPLDNNSTIYFIIFRCLYKSNKHLVVLLFLSFFITKKNKVRNETIARVYAYLLFNLNVFKYVMCDFNIQEKLFYELFLIKNFEK